MRRRRVIVDSTSSSPPSSHSILLSRIRPLLDNELANVPICWILSLRDLRFARDDEDDDITDGRRGELPWVVRGCGPIERITPTGRSQSINAGTKYGEGRGALKKKAMRASGKVYCVVLVQKNKAPRFTSSQCTILARNGWACPTPRPNFLQPNLPRGLRRRVPLRRSRQPDLFA